MNSEVACFSWKSNNFLRQLLFTTLKCNLYVNHKIRGGGTPYNGLYGEAPPERGTFSGFRYMKVWGFYSLKYTKA